MIALKVASFAFLWLLCSDIATTTLNAEVVSDAPDLSRFKLRPVNINSRAEQQVVEQIVDIGEGAELLHESLFVSDQLVHCIAYSHLFKMIGARRKVSDPVKLRPIKETTIQSLAIVAEVDRAVYFEMFRQQLENDEQSTTLGALFREAIEEVEKRKGVGARDTWLDLMHCASAHFKTQLEGFLRGKGRLHKAQELVEKSGSRTRTTLLDLLTLDGWRQRATKVSWQPDATQLQQKFDGKEPKWRPILSQELRSARYLIEMSDDEELALLRKIALERLSQEHALKNQDGDSTSLFEYNALESLIASEPVGVEKESNKVSQEIEVDAPSEISASKADPNKDWPEFKRMDTRLAIVRYTLMRLDQLDDVKRSEIRLDYDLVPRLTPMVAFHFVSHWIELKRLRSVPSNDRESLDLFKRIKAFVNDKPIIRAAARIHKATKDYRRLLELIAELKDKQEKRSFGSFSELDSKYKEALALVECLSEILNVDDIKRGFAKKAASELKQYTALNSFIESDMW